MTAAELLNQLTRLGVVATATPDGFLDLEPAESLTPELLETIKAHKSAILEHLATSPKPFESSPRPNQDNRPPLPRLPHHLEALGRAASSGFLPGGAITLETGIVTDLTAFVFAWGWAYLTGAGEDAITRLEAAHAVWTRARGVN